MPSNYDGDVNVKLNPQTKANISSQLKTILRSINNLSINIKHAYLKESAVKDIQNALNKAKINLKINPDTSKIKQQAKNIGQNISQNISQNIGQGMRQTSVTAEKTEKETKSSLQKIGSTAGLLFSSTSMILRTTNFVKSGLSIVYNLDNLLVSLKKNTAMTTWELENFYHSANDIAKQMGATTEEILSQALAWGKLGFNSAEASAKMAKLSSQFKLISPGMTSDEATNGLASIMKAYDIDVDDVLDGVMSKISAVGNSFSLANSDIITMLRDSASAMRDGNSTLDETIALETAAFEITRDKNVGSGFKAAALRLRGLNEETQKADESLKTIQSDLYKLTGVSIMEDEDTYKSPYKILKEMSEVWDSLGDKTKTKTLEIMFGENGANAGAAAIENFSAAEKAMAKMANSSGTADSEMISAMDSVEYKFNKLKETGANIAQNLFERDELKDTITILTNLAEVVENLTDIMGFLPVVIGTVYTAMKGISGGLIRLI